MTRHSASSASVWSALDILVRQSFSFIVSVILARLLTPADFGVVALASFFSSAAIALLQSGLTTALIQRRTSSEEENSAVFWWCLIATAVASGFLIALAPWLAGYFALPVLRPLMAMAALQLLFAALGVVPTALLTRALDIKPLAKVGFVASIVSGALGVGAGLIGLGVWAIAIQLVSMSLVNSIGLWFLSGWRPLAHWHLASVRPVLRFSLNLSAVNVLEILYTNGFALVVGKLHGVADLGLYNRAQGTQQLPGNVVSMILARVSLPVFARNIDDRDRLVKDVRTTIRVAMLFNLPAMALLTVLSDIIIVTLFGGQWTAAAPILTILAIGGALIPLHVINLQLLLAQDRSDRYLKIEAVKKTAGIACVIGGSLFGIMGLAIGQAIFNVAAFFINAHYTGRSIGYGAGRQLRDIAPIALASAGAAAVVWLVRPLTSSSPALSLLVLLAVGAMAYLPIAGLMARRMFPDQYSSGLRWVALSLPGRRRG